MASKARTSNARASVRRSARRAALIAAVLVYVGERLLLDSYTETYARSYRPPVIALAYPAPGGSVAQERPVIVLRFVPGEPRDPVDLSTLTITVDGEDRTAWFELSPSEAWGALAGTARDAAGATPHGSVDGENVVRVHRIAARVCSVRGVCGRMGAIVRVVGASAPANAPAAAPPSAPDENRR